MSELDWNSMKDRQTAGKAFIRYMIDHPRERDAAALNPAYAREVFQREGRMKLPPDVQMMIVPEDRQERDKLNVIMIPKEDEDPDPLRYWIAAWIPYDDRAVPPAR
jgi:hypothetical protein